MERILRTEQFCGNGTSFGRLDEKRTRASRKRSETEPKTFEEALELCCYNNIGTDVGKEKEGFGYQGDDLGRLENEIRNLDHDTFVRIFEDSYYDGTLYLTRNADQNFYDELYNWDLNLGSLLRNDGGWKETDKYAAIVYYEYDSDLTWVCSFGDDNFPTGDQRFMDYFLYDVVGIQDMDVCLGKFGFRYEKSLELNKRNIAAEYGYSESLADLLYGMYLRYCEHEGVEPEIQ